MISMIVNVDGNYKWSEKHWFELWIREMTCEHDYMIAIPFQLLFHAENIFEHFSLNR